MSTIVERIATGTDEAKAIGAPGRPSLTHGGLRALSCGPPRAERARDRPRRPGRDRACQRTGDGDGLRRRSPAAATTAPLNPAYREEEFDFYLTDLRAKALVVARATTGPGGRGRPAARHRGAAARSPARARPAGSASPRAGRRAARSGRRACRGRRHRARPAHLRHDLAAEDRAALPAQPRRLGAATSARRWRSAPSDRCLNVMPLFHIHGLIAAVLASLAAGGSVVLHAGLQRAALLPLARRSAARPGTRPCRPCTRRSSPAPPRNAERIAASRLRFIRSSSASLPPQVMAALEETFGAPVIEAYGMTEAAHQMTTNPLPPRRAQAGLGRHRRRAARSRSWTTDGAPAAAGRGRRGRDPRPERDRRATRPTRRPTPRLLRRAAGSAPATRARSTPTAICASPAG